MQHSYSKKTFPWDNACIESFHAIIKREFLNRFKIPFISLSLDAGCRPISLKSKSATRKCKHFLVAASAFILARLVAYSNSIVPGGLLVKSYITLLTPLTSLMIRFMTLFSTSYGISAASAVMKSIVLTALNATA